jgi:FkbM family methyltransferase
MVTLKHRPETLTINNDLVMEYVTSLPEGDVFYDLGACVGTYSLVGLDRKLNVVAFEVDKVNFNAIKENLEINNFKDYNFQCFNIGIADKEREIELRIGQPEIGGHHKTLNLESYCGYPHLTQHYPITIVKADSLDNIINKHYLPLPDHIKIDIDGSEYAFLEGAHISLMSAKSIIIELYEHNEYFQKIMDVLIKKYKFKLVTSSKDLEPGLKDYWFKKETLDVD